MLMCLFGVMDPSCSDSCFGVMDPLLQLMAASPTGMHSMPHDPSGKKPRTVIDLAEVRRRLDAEQEDAVTPLREAFMEEMGELLADYLDAVREMTGNDGDKALEEIMAACSALLALAAEDQFEDLDDQVDFIDTVADIATELIGGEDETVDMVDDGDGDENRR